MYIQSLYTYLFKRDGRFYLYNAQSSFFCEISEQIHANLFNRNYDSLSDDTLGLFVTKKVLVRQEEKYLYYNECKSKFYREANDASTLGLVIAPTISCNFNCPYCFESKEDSCVMSENIETKLIEFIKKYESLRVLNLTLYGGEPLIAFNRIKSLWNRLKEAFPSLKVQNQTFVTNGWLITDEVIRFFKDSALKNIQVTLDGIEEHHNKTRCLKNGTPTYRKIVTNIEKMATALPELNISVRVNVNRQNPSDLAAISTYFKENGFDKIYVYPGFIREDTKDTCSLTYNSYSGNSLHEFFKQASKEGVKTSFLPNQCSGRSCLMNSINNLIIGPSGEIYKCWNDVGHKERLIGYIYGDEPINKVRLYRYLNDTSAFGDIECKDCHVFPLCDGGCGHYRYRNTFENGRFDLCTRYKDNSVLEDALLMSIKS